MVYMASGLCKTDFLMPANSIAESLVEKTHKN